MHRAAMHDSKSSIVTPDPTGIAGTVEAHAPWSTDQLADCHPSLLRLYDYWDLRRGTRLMPGRADIDPVEIKTLLPLVILIDVVADPRRYVYRLVGTHEVEMRGADPTGKPVAEAYYGESAEDTIGYLDRVVRTRQPILYRGTYQPYSTRVQREDVLFLPLSQDGDTVNMIVMLGRIDWIKDEVRL